MKLSSRVAPIDVYAHWLCFCSDGRIYVFTTEKNRKASAEVAAAYDDAVAVKVAKELERKERQVEPASPSTELQLSSL